MSKWLRLLGLVLVLGVGLVSALILVAILWSDPSFATPFELSLSDLEAAASSEPIPAVEIRTFLMPDGATLSAEIHLSGPADTVLYLHGVLSAASQLASSAHLLSQATGARVVALDLRGHGRSQGKPGDTRYLGQFEDDVAAVVRELRAESPTGRLVLAGHSMGGGIALRYADKRELPPVDGYLLLAPHLGWSSPTTRKETSEAGAAFVRLHVPRLLALRGLNAVGLSLFNGLRVMYFNLPAELPLRSYSYRALLGGTPDNYRQALARIQVPLLVVVGERDEAFVAGEYEVVVRGYSQGTVKVVPAVDHNGILRAPAAMEEISRWWANP